MRKYIFTKGGAEVAFTVVRGREGEPFHEENPLAYKEGLAPPRGGYDAAFPDD